MHKFFKLIKYKKNFFKMNNFSICVLLLVLRLYVFRVVLLDNYKKSKKNAQKRIFLKVKKSVQKDVKFNKVQKVNLYCVIQILTCLRKPLVIFFNLTLPREFFLSCVSL